MAFWAQGSSNGGCAQLSSSSGPTPTRPVSYVLGSSGPLLDHASLVRLRVDVPSTVAALAAAAVDEGGDDEETAAQVAQAAVCAVGQLNEVIRGIEDKAEDARVAAVLEVMQDKTLQLLCSKAVVAKVYKSLLPHQEALGFSMAPAKACLSQKPVAGWDLQESLQTAVIKTLTGSSTGTAPCSSSSGPSTTPAGTQGQLQSQHGWMCLSRHKLVGSNLLSAVPGQVSTALFAELEVAFDAGKKSMLLIVHAAGSLKFRPFSPCQVLQQDAKSLKAPLTLDDSDSDLLSDPIKLAAAARQLDRRPVKLLPDDRLVFIKGLSAAPTDPTQLQRTTQFWLGCYGLLLQPSFPFLVGVATHPEAEAAQMQVPSCCVLTNLGLSALHGSQPGGSCHTAAVSRLAADLQAAAAGYSLWGHKLTVQLKGGGGAGAGLSQAKMQLTQATSQPAAGEGAGASAVQLQAYSLQNQWKPASELSKLQAQAGKQPQQKQAQQQGTTAAEMQLMGLVEADPWAVAGGGPGRLVGSSRQEGVRGDHRGASSSADKSRWEGLKAYLAEKESQQKTQLQLSAGQGIAAPAAASSLFTSARTLASKVAGTPAAGAAAGAARVTAAAAGGAPAAPRFGNRKPGVSKPPSAAVAAAKAPKAKKPGGGVSKLLEGLQAAHVEAAGAAAAAVAGQDTAAGGSLVTQPATAEAARPSAPVIAPKAPALGKRPGAADAAVAAAKPPAAKKAKTAAGAGAGAAAKPKAPKKPKAAAAGAAAPAEAAAGADAATAGAAAPAGAAAEQGAGLQPAAADQQQQRKRTKASDLDLAAVTAKIQAAFAASAGATLKGVSVPEMQCYLRAQGVKGGSAKRADVEARLLQLMAGQQPAAS